MQRIRKEVAEQIILENKLKEFPFYTEKCVCYVSSDGCYVIKCYESSNRYYANDNVVDDLLYKVEKKIRELVEDGRNE